MLSIRSSPNCWNRTRVLRAVVILHACAPPGRPAGTPSWTATWGARALPLGPACLRAHGTLARRALRDRWGHFDALDYQGDKRKLYAFCLIEAHSRMLYIEFTHSQSFETFARCHQHAFQVLGGVARDVGPYFIPEQNRSAGSVALHPSRERHGRGPGENAPGSGRGRIPTTRHGCRRG